MFQALKDIKYLKELGLNYIKQAKSGFALKRGQGTGYSGIINTLFFRENCRMIYGDAKATVGSMVAQFEE